MERGTIYPESYLAKSRIVAHECHPLIQEVCALPLSVLSKGVLPKSLKMRIEKCGTAFLGIVMLPVEDPNLIGPVQQRRPYAKFLSLKCARAWGEFVVEFTPAERAPKKILHLSKKYTPKQIGGK